MTTKCINFFFSSIIIITSVLTLLNHTLENILLIGVIKVVSTRFLNVLDLNWILQLGMISSLAGAMITPTLSNCAIVISLGFAETYLLFQHFINKEANDFLTSKSLSKAVQGIEKTKLVEPFLITVEPAPLASIYQVPDLTKGPEPDTLSTLVYAPYHFKLKK